MNKVYKVILSVWTGIRSLAVVLLACLAVLWFSSPVVAQTILRVDGQSGSTSGDGSDWGASAFKYPQDALAAAPNHTPPVQIWVRGASGTFNGVYYPDQLQRRIGRDRPSYRAIRTAR